MTGITATEARSNLYRLIDETAESHQPIVIMGKRNKAVLVSEEDWSAIQETLYLPSVPGMRESIREGMETPVYECDEGWTGDREVGLHQASPGRCQEVGLLRPQTKKPGVFSADSGRSLPQTASV